MSMRCGRKFGIEYFLVPDRGCGQKYRQKKTWPHAYGWIVMVKHTSMGHGTPTAKARINFFDVLLCICLEFRHYEEVTFP